MKGVVFTEFLEMVEDRFSQDMANEIVDEADLPSGGAYSRIGTYDHKEMLQLVAGLSRRTGIPAADLIRAYGTYLFGRFHEIYPVFFEGVSSTFEFLGLVEDYIHKEVRKFYPDAELPAFDLEKSTPEEMVMVYRSRRPFAPLAEGLIRGCIEHFGDEIEVDVTDLSEGKGTEARIALRRTAPG